MTRVLKLEELSMTEPVNGLKKESELQSRTHLLTISSAYQTIIVKKKTVNLSGSSTVKTGCYMPNPHLK